MSESASIQPNKTVLMLLGAIVVLLAVIAGIIIAQGADTSVPSPTAQTPATQPTGDTNAGAPAGVAPPAADFDPTAATVVPEGVTPEDFVAGYYEAILAGEWEDAFGRQPVAKQTGSVADFQAQVEGYGVVGYTIMSAEEQGEQYVVMVDQETGAYGIFENQWVFLKDGDGWVVQDKAVTGMK